MAMCKLVSPSGWDFGEPDATALRTIARGVPGYPAANRGGDGFVPPAADARREADPGASAPGKEARRGDG